MLLIVDWFRLAAPGSTQTPTTHHDCCRSRRSRRRRSRRRMSRRRRRRRRRGRVEVGGRVVILRLLTRPSEPAVADK